MSSGNLVTNSTIGTIGTYFPGLEPEPPPQKVDDAVGSSFLELLKMDDLSKVNLSKMDWANPIDLLACQFQMAGKETAVLLCSKLVGMGANGVQTVMNNQV